MQKLFEALAKAQGQMQRVAKNSKNPHFKSNYANLDDIIDMARPILNEHGLALIQVPVFDGQSCGVRSTITHSSGDHYDCGELLLPLGRGGGAQGAGSSISYARRYSFASIFCISLGDDDDGNHAQSNKPPRDEEKEAIQAALVKLSKDHGRDASLAVLAEMGVKQVSELPKGSLEKVMSLIQEKSKVEQ